MIQEHQPSTPGAFHIIQAGTEHLNIVFPLFDAYRQFYEQPSNPDGARDFIRERMERNESVIFLALAHPPSEGAQSGIGFAQLYPTFTSIGMRRAWLFNDLFVAPEARKRGVAEALLLKARDFGIATRAQYLALETARSNAPAQRLYERLGWVCDTEHLFYTLRLPLS